MSDNWELLSLEQVADLDRVLMNRILIRRIQGNRLTEREIHCPVDLRQNYGPYVEQIHVDNPDMAFEQAIDIGLDRWVQDLGELPFEEIEWEKVTRIGG